MLMDSIPTLPPRTTSILWNSSLISLTTASFLVAVWTNRQEKALQECMEALPEKQRLCIRYFFMDELSYKEIGQTSGFTLKMVKSFIQNGKRNLQLCLERKGIKANE